MEKLKISSLYNFSPKQKTAQQAVHEYDYVLYGGAMGGGKSYWLRWMLIHLLLCWSKLGHTGVEVGLFCEDYPTLKDRQISKIEKEFPPWLGVFHSDHKAHGKCYILSEDYGGGIIKLRNLDDSSKYQSAEFAAVAVDELTKNDFEVFEDLRNRLRWTGIDDTKFLAGTNPGGKGHAWAKRYWMDRDFPPEETEPNEFKYIQAIADDNPHLSPKYLQKLDSLSPEKRRAFREGDWDIFKGQYFSEWRREIHIVKPFDIPPHWPRFIMGDYGYTAPSAALWGAIDEDGRVFVYRELYKTGLTYENLAKEIISLTPPSEEIKYWVFDPAIWAKGNEKEGEPMKVSGAELMSRKYKEITGRALNIVRGNNDRVNGWLVMHERLNPYPKDDYMTADLLVFPHCTNLIRTLPSLEYDQNNVEDVDSDGEDHAPDALRYGVMSRPRKAPSTQHPVTRLLNRQVRETQTSYD